MRFAFKTSPQDTTWPDMLAVWKAADDIELFESGWTFDHFYPIFSDSTGPCMEGWITLTALAQALRLQPNNVHALYNLGTALTQLGRLSAALASYERAIAVDAGLRRHVQTAVVGGNQQRGIRRQRLDQSGQQRIDPDRGGVPLR